MNFEVLDIDCWERKEHYLHFINEVVCTYSTTVTLDITPLKGQRLYPAMLWLLTKTVNQLPEFRTSLRSDSLGIYDQMHPAYTLFNEERKIFVNVWTEYKENYKDFLASYQEDVHQYSSSPHLVAKSGRPENSFDVSMIPWLQFTSFNLNIYNEGKYLLPIFSLGKYEDQNGKRVIPLAIQVHHAVCDGYHVGQFVELLQQEIYHFTGQ